MSRALALSDGEGRGKLVELGSDPELLRELRCDRIDLQAQQAARQIDASADADTLRRMEREEIQRLTLGWLVPGFLTSSAAPSAPTEPQGLSDASWQQALEYGEYIKFAHAAIDWARLSYFLYPYFWSDRQMDRLFLRHPDPIHRDFLRAGRQHSAGSMRAAGVTRGA